MSAVMRAADFKSLQPQTQAALGDPYFCCFQECLYGSALAGYLEPDDEKVDIVYSQQDEFRSRFQLIFDGWKQRYSDGDGSNLGTLSFADMRGSPALQLADLLAYPRWTPQNRPSIDTSNPATTRSRPRLVSSISRPPRDASRCGPWSASSVARTSGRGRDGAGDRGARSRRRCRRAACPSRRRGDWR